MEKRQKIQELVLSKTKMIEAGSTIPETADLIYDLGLDSLTLVELITDLEIEFDIEIDVEDVEKILKFNDLVRYIIYKTNQYIGG